MRAACLLLVALACISRAGDPPAGPKLRGKATTRGHDTLLSDVAALPSGQGALGDLVLAPAPAPGQTLRLRREEVRAALQAAGRADLLVLGATEVVVQAECVPLDGETLVALAREHALTSLAAPGVTVEAVAAGAPPPAVVLAPVGRTSSALALRWRDDRPAVGRAVVEVVVELDGRAGLVVPVTLEVRRLAAGAVAARALQAGKLLAPADLREATVLLGPGASPPPPAAALVGGLLRRALRPNQALGPDDVGPAPIVRRGEPVTVNLGLGGLTISLQGTAGGDGAAGESIPVQLPGRPSLEARVEAPGQVRVVLPSETP